MVVAASGSWESVGRGVGVISELSTGTMNGHILYVLCAITYTPCMSIPGMWFTQLNQKWPVSLENDRSVIDFFFNYAKDEM